MKDRILSLALTVIMLASLVFSPIHASAAEFKYGDDGTSSTWNWASSYIYEAYNKGIFTGDDQGKFNADSSLTRAEAVTAVLALKYVTVNSDCENSGFTDSDRKWYTPYVAAAKTEGITSGYIDGTFKPNSSITRAEFVTILVSAAGYMVDMDTTDSGFTDSNGSWYTPYIAAAKQNGLSKGYSDGGFHPNAKISRAEAATMIVSVNLENEKHLNYFADDKVIGYMDMNISGDIVYGGEYPSLPIVVGEVTNISDEPVEFNLQYEMYEGDEIMWTQCGISEHPYIDVGETALILITDLHGDKGYYMFSTSSASSEYNETYQTMRIESTQNNDGSVDFSFNTEVGSADGALVIFYYDEDNNVTATDWVWFSGLCGEEYGPFMWTFVSPTVSYNHYKIYFQTL